VRLRGVGSSKAATTGKEKARVNRIEKARNPKRGWKAERGKEDREWEKIKPEVRSPVGNSVRPRGVKTGGLHRDCGHR